MSGLTPVKSPEFLLSLDTDWAPDFIIDEVASILVKAGVRATWFVTHTSPAVKRLVARKDLFDIGWHPNFKRGSSHGEDEATVLNTFRREFPGAKVMRPHGLAQSSSMFHYFGCKGGIVGESSAFLPHTPGHQACIQWNWGHPLVRIPYVWEDDCEMMRPSPLWNFPEFAEGKRDFVVFDFHPVHIFLNNDNLGPYEELKARAGTLQSAIPEHVEGLYNKGAGPRTMFDGLVSHLAHVGGGRTLSEVVDETLAAAGVRP